jgi:hypothetical protein
MICRDTCSKSPFALARLCLNRFNCYAVESAVGEARGTSIDRIYLSVLTLEEFSDKRLAVILIIPAMI